jgi:hypothetical protein
MGKQKARIGSPWCNHERCVQVRRRLTHWVTSALRAAVFALGAARRLMT